MPCIFFELYTSQKKSEKNSEVNIENTKTPIREQTSNIKHFFKGKGIHQVSCVNMPFLGLDFLRFPINTRCLVEATN